MTTESILNIVLSIVTAATAITAIIISVVQINKSNKQSLFERRLRAFLTVKWMVALCKEMESLEKTYLKDAEEEPILSIELFFGWMTNNAFFEEIQLAINHPLEPEWKRKYLLKMEELRNLCEEVRLIFPEKIGFPVADFIFSYEEMIMAMYRYKIAIDALSRSCDQTKRPMPNDDPLESRQRKVVVKYISDTFGYAEKLFEEDILEKAKGKIKL